MSNKANIQHNKLMKLDHTMLMYGIYNAETLEKLIKTVHEIHSTTTSHEKLFAGEHNHYLEYFIHTLYVYNSIPPTHSCTYGLFKINIYHFTGN